MTVWLAALASAANANATAEVNSILVWFGWGM